jgi:psiF repeat
MLRLMTAAALAAYVLATPAVAATNEQKMETCKFGADDQKLEGAKRKAYMAKCMSNKDSPRGKAVGTPAPKPQ